MFSPDWPGSDTGANVTTPYKQDVAGRGGEESVNTLLFDPLRATSTDAAILEGLEHERR